MFTLLEVNVFAFFVCRFTSLRVQFFRYNILGVRHLARFTFLLLSPAVHLNKNKYWLDIYLFFNYVVNYTSVRRV